MSRDKRGYKEKLADPRWQKLRLKKLEQSGWKCERCQNEKLELHVHHKQYKGFKSPWNYPLKELQVLCHACHQIEHVLKDYEDDLGNIVRPSYVGDPLPEIVTPAASRDEDRIPTVEESKVFFARLREMLEE